MSVGCSVPPSSDGFYGDVGKSQSVDCPDHLNWCKNLRLPTAYAISNVEPPSCMMQAPHDAGGDGTGHQDLDMEKREQNMMHPSHSATITPYICSDMAFAPCERINYLLCDRAGSAPSLVDSQRLGGGGGPPYNHATFANSTHLRRNMIHLLPHVFAEASALLARIEPCKAIWGIYACCVVLIG